MHEIINTLNTKILSWDILFILFVFISSLFYGIILGKNRIMLTMLSTYISFAIVSVFPFYFLEDVFGKINLPLWRVILFISFVVFSFMLLNRSFFGHLFKVSKALSNTSFKKIFLLSFSQMGLFVSIFFSFLMIDIKTTDFSVITEVFFMYPASQVFWFFLPILLLGIFKNNKTHQ